MINVKKITSSDPYPSTWTATSENGENISIRFRDGLLKINVDGYLMFNRPVETDGDQSQLEYDELKEATEGIMDLPEREHVSDFKF